MIGGEFKILSRKDNSLLLILPCCTNTKSNHILKVYLLTKVGSSLLQIDPALSWNSSQTTRNAVYKKRSKNLSSLDFDFLYFKDTFWPVVSKHYIHA